MAQTTIDRLSKHAAYQMLHPFEAVESGRLVGAPVEDMSSTYVFAVRATVQVGAVSDTTDGTAYCAVTVQPSLNNHMYVATSFNNGVPTGTVAYDVAEYSSINAAFSSYRCAGIGLRVRSTLRKDAINGSAAIGNLAPITEFNTLSYVNWQNNALSHNYSVVDGDIASMTWWPFSGDPSGLTDQTPFAWHATTDASEADSTGIQWMWNGTIADGGTFLVETVMVVEAVVDQTSAYLFADAMRSYPVSKNLFAVYVLEAFDPDVGGIPFLDQARIMGRDDGFLSKVAKVFKSTAKSAVQLARDTINPEQLIRVGQDIAGLPAASLPTLGMLSVAASLAKRISLLNRESRAYLRRVLTAHFDAEGALIDGGSLAEEDQLLRRTASQMYRDHECSYTKALIRARAEGVQVHVDEPDLRGLA